MISLDIVIVAYRSEADLPSVLSGIETMTALRHKVHLFDNIGNPKTLTIAWNDLARQGFADYIAFLNTDIRLSPAWDLRAVEGLSRHDTVSIMANPVGHDWPEVAFGEGPKYPDPAVAPAPTVEAMARIAMKWRDRRDDYGYGECNAPYFAVIVKREAWESLHGFDERFRFYGQDHDFQRRAYLKFGKPTVRVASSAIWHRCAASTREAAVRGEVDLNAEMVHCGKVMQQIASGSLKPWDQLSDMERQSVRRSTLYSRMPR